MGVPALPRLLRRRLHQLLQLRALPQGGEWVSRGWVLLASRRVGRGPTLTCCRRERREAHTTPLCSTDVHRPPLALPLPACRLA